MRPDVPFTYCSPSTIIKDRSNETGDVFINIDEIIEIQEAVIADITAERDGEKDPKKKEKYKKTN